MSAADLPIDAEGRAVVPVRDCWNRIGVQGDGSCPRLEQHVHCRNCPVFSDTAVRLLEREAPSGYLADATAHFAASKPADRREIESAILFRIGAEWLALPTLLLDEVAERRRVHSLPHRRGGTVLGIVNIRGELLVCVSLAKILAIDEPAAAEPKGGRTVERLLVVRHDGARLALPVDEVQTTVRYHVRDVRPPPPAVARSAGRYSRGVLSVGGRTVGCLDAEAIVAALSRVVA